jgi:uncharacterized membrane protein YfcA
MHDVLTALAGLGVGFVVGMTGMGGGALMTPMLVILFGVNPGAAVSSDLVAALVMKPVGGAVHLRRGTVHRGLVRWLCIGSVPAAFAGAVLLRFAGNGSLENHVSTFIGVALLLAASGMIAKTVLGARRPDTEQPRRNVNSLPVKWLPTLAIGVFGGLIVGLTSVGSGSLMLVLLLVLYPSLTAGQLVGTDLVQAIPLVGSAALGHLLFGHVELGLTAALIIGSVPGVYLGARVSAVAPDRIIRPVIVFVLIISALKLLGLGNTELAWATLALTLVSVAAFAAWRQWIRPLRRPSGVAQEGGRLPEVVEQRGLDLRGDVG